MMAFNSSVLWLEVRLRVRERRMWLVAGFFLASLLVMGYVPLLSLRWTRAAISPDQMGASLLLANRFFLFLLFMVLSPLAGAGSLSQEREQRTLAGLLNSPLHPWEIVGGKLVAAWLFVLWLLSLGLPFFAGALIWGGGDAAEVGRFFLWCMAASMTTAAVGVGMSGVFHRTVNSYLATGAVLFFWVAAWPLVGFLLSQFWRPEEPAARAAFTRFVELTFYLHNPLAVFFGGITGQGEGLLYPLAVWAGIVVLFFLLGVRSLKRGLWEKP